MGGVFTLMGICLHLLLSDQDPETEASGVQKEQLWYQETGASNHRNGSASLRLFESFCPFQTDVARHEESHKAVSHRVLSRASDRSSGEARRNRTPPKNPSPH